MIDAIRRSGRRGTPRWERRVIGGEAFVVLTLSGYGIGALAETAFSHLSDEAVVELFGRAVINGLAT